jgi:hypothetical protein
MNALKLIAYSGTAAMVGGVFAIIPALGILTLIAGIYSLYLLYLGVPTLMKVPQEKALPYTVVLVVCAIVIGVVAGTVLGAVQGGPSMHMSSAPSGSVSMEKPRVAVTVPAGQITVDTPKGAISVDVAKAQDWSKQMEEVGKKMEKAQQSGDQAAMELALKEMTALQQSMPMKTPGR